eukprot:365369-Chlamydomonas_euryale.AAC.2
MAAQIACRGLLASIDRFIPALNRAGSRHISSAAPGPTLTRMHVAHAWAATIGRARPAAPRSRPVAQSAGAVQLGAQALDEGQENGSTRWVVLGKDDGRDVERANPATGSRG